MRKVLVLAALCAPAIAMANGFDVIDRGDAVEVIAHDTHATRTGILPIRSRLEVPIAPRPIAKTLEADPTVKLVEIDGGRLSVKTGFEHEDVVQLAKYAQAIQVGPDLHVILPRKVPAAGTAPVLPLPTAPAAVKPVEAPKPAETPAAPAAASVIPSIAPQLGPIAVTPKTAPAAPTPAPTAPAPAPVAAATTKPAEAQKAEAQKAEAPKAEAPKAEAPKLPEKAEAPKLPEKPTTLAPDDSTSGKLPIYGGAGLAALLLGGYVLRKKRGATAAATTIDVIAQRSLGGKARIVWLAAGPRELLVTVTPQHVRLVGQWKKGDAPAASLPFAQTLAAAGAAAPIPSLPRAATAPEHLSSPAIAGLLKLRDQANELPPINEDVATGDADADSEWAREILRATGGRK